MSIAATQVTGKPGRRQEERLWNEVPCRASNCTITGKSVVSSRRIIESCSIKGSEVLIRKDALSGSVLDGTKAPWPRFLYRLFLSIDPLSFLRRIPMRHVKLAASFLALVPALIFGFPASAQEKA